MKSFVSLLLTILFLSGCGSKSSSSHWFRDSDPQGPSSKIFILDAEKKLIYVGVFGRYITTPDFELVNNYLESKRNLGVTNSVEVIATGIEGGAGYCVDIRDQDARKIVLDELTQLQTSVAETSYSVISVNDCTCYRQDTACN